MVNPSATLAAFSFPFHWLSTTLPVLVQFARFTTLYKAHLYLINIGKICVGHSMFLSVVFALLSDTFSFFSHASRDGNVNMPVVVPPLLC